MATEAEGKGWQHGSELRRSVSAAAKRIEEILLDAERAAEQIRRDAETEAEAYLSQRRREANAFVEDQLGQLQMALDGFREQLSEGESNRDQSDASGEGSPTLPNVFAYPGRTEVTVEAAPAGDRRDEALIRATQLAIKGTERALIVEALRREFVRTDAEAIVAEILD